MNPAQFVEKWKPVALPERAASQEHFLDLCRMLDQPSPATFDKTGAEYTFEKGVAVTDSASKGSKGESGFADVWWRGKFGWEYKRKDKHKTLEEAYRQLLQYREALENPPLLIVSDISRIEIHTNFTGTAKEVHTIALAEMTEPRSIDLLRRIFTDPGSFKPQQTSEQITRDVAHKFGQLAASISKRGHDPHDVAHFLMKCMFCLFAEDVDLLPRKLFEKTLRQWHGQPAKLPGVLETLFTAMETGGAFGADPIDWFNGGLFHGSTPIELTSDEIGVLLLAATRDWSQVRPEIFGTLFERSLDPEKRSQIGAHYTSYDDIMLIVEPVVMQPLRREWADVQEEIEKQLERRRKAATKATKEKADQTIAKALDDFMNRLASVRILDPACGSGNFLYVAIQQLLDLEKEVITFAARPEIGGGLLPGVRPTQLRGIEINNYASELAQVVIWIGYLQWMRENGFNMPRDPVLEPIQTIERRDAILKWGDGAGNEIPAYEEGAVCLGVADWPQAEFIIGNPPFLGSKLFRKWGLPDGYIEAMYRNYEIPNTSDLCCYWFERARRVIEGGKAGTEACPTTEQKSSGGGAGVPACSPGEDAAMAGTEACPTGKRPSPHGGVRRGGSSACLSPRVGLLATQGIRGGSNRETLKRIKDTGDIFMAWSDRPWVLDGAAVHVSIVGFDGGEEQERVLDGVVVESVHADLRGDLNLSAASPLDANRSVGWSIGTQKGGSFEFEYATAHELLVQANPADVSNADVIRPWRNAADVTGRLRGLWCVYFRDLAHDVAAQYEGPFEYVKKQVKPFRDSNRRKSYRELWWIHQEPRNELRNVLETETILLTPRVAKHRLWVRTSSEILPDCALVAFARSDDYFFGVLHSSIHELWARRMGTQLREAESGFRYTPTTCFETFPLPWPPGKEPSVVGQASVPAMQSSVGQASVPAMGKKHAGTPTPPKREQAGDPPRRTPPSVTSGVSSSVGQASVPAMGKKQAETPAPLEEKRREAGGGFEMYRRRLPHWRLPGSVYFVTWRLHDTQKELEPSERTVIVEALRHFEGERYDLHAYVVMNDHVHVLLFPHQGESLSKIMHSWKSFTARRLQQESGRRGKVWQDESFDRVVRDEDEHLEKMNYILTNAWRRWPGVKDYEWQGMGGKAGTEACPTTEGMAGREVRPTTEEREAQERISEAARELNEQRERWLNPPEWIEPIAKTIDVLNDFSDVPEEARPLIRESAIQARAAQDPRLKKRTLTNLYNQRPTWLANAHEKLDRAVLAAYAATDPKGEWDEGWAAAWVATGAGQTLPDNASEEEKARRAEVEERVLANLLRLNQQRA